MIQVERPGSGDAAWRTIGIRLEAKDGGADGHREDGAVQAPITIAILYFPCRWFAAVKRRRKDWWLSYL